VNFPRTVNQTRQPIFFVFPFSPPTYDHTSPISSLQLHPIVITASVFVRPIVTFPVSSISHHLLHRPITIRQHDFECRWLGVATSSHSHGRLQSPHQFSGALAAHFPWSPARLHRIQHSDNGERPFHLVTSPLPFPSNPTRVFSI
jgi:hypothetical protein